MNRFNFLQQVGYPLDMNDFDKIQTAYNLFNTLGHLAGNLSILTGCVVAGSTVGDGVVVINGEVLEFRGGALGDNVIIIEEPETKEFENGNVNEVHFIRYATFGTSDVFYVWENFKPIFPSKDIPQALGDKEDKTTVTALVERINTLELKTAVFQSGGGMVLWNKPANQIPIGWAEVTNWRGRIPVGFDATQTEFNTMGKTNNNNKKVTLTQANIPNYDLKRQVGRETVQAGPFVIWSSAPGNQYEQKINSGGSGVAFDILNPYRVVLFIEWLGIPQI